MIAGTQRSFYTIVGLLLFASWASVQFRFIGVPGNDWHDAINSDGKGYYEYIRMVLTPGDPSLHAGKGPLHPTVNAPVIKHFCGAAVCMAPFVLVAHIYTLFNVGKPEDGYSLHYQIAVGIASLTFLAIGLFALRRYLLRLGSTDGVVSIVLIVLALGTGLITQAVVHPAMSHVYGFTTIAVLFLVAQRLFREPTASGVIACAGLLGLAILIRPVNALVVIALPLAAFGSELDKEGLKNLVRPSSILLAALAFTGVLSVQGLLWYLQSGSFLIDGYRSEGFHWDRPHVLDSLISARNGLFFYWPLMLLVIPGSVLLFRRSRSTALWFLLFAVPFVYVSASWWNWAYGDNFGQRTYLDMLPVFALPITLAIPIAQRWRRLLALLVFLLCALNLFQSWQYLNNLLVTGQMDWPKYKHIFLCTHRQHAIAVGGHDELPRYAPHGMETIPLRTIDPRPRADHGHAFNDLVLAPLPERAMGVPVFTTIHLERTEAVPGASRDAMVAVQFLNNGVMRTAQRWRMNGVPDAAPDLAHWQYAFTMQGQQHGDTLVIGASNSPGYRVTHVDLRLSVPRER